MLERWQFWMATLIALLLALAVGYCMMLFSQNRAAQVEFAQRAQYLQQSAQLQVVYREMVKALADLSVTNRDQALTDLLAKQGITVTPTDPVRDAPAAQPDPAKAKR